MRAISGDADDFTAAIGGLPSKRILRRVSELADRFEDSLVGGARDFFERTSRRTVGRRLTVDRFKRKAKAVRRASNNLFRSNDIRLLGDIGDFQHAPGRQLRFLMADPEVRRRYHLNRLAGYEERYEDLQPGVIGEDHYDYRVMNHGHVRHHDDGTFGARFYPQVLRHSDDELDFEDQVDILDSNKRLRWWLEQENEDPTSRWNVLL